MSSSYILISLFRFLVLSLYYFTIRYQHDTLSTQKKRRMLKVEKKKRKMLKIEKKKNSSTKFLISMQPYSLQMKYEQYALYYYYFYLLYLIVRNYVNLQTPIWVLFHTAHSGHVSLPDQSIQDQIVDLEEQSGVDTCKGDYEKIGWPLVQAGRSV